VRNRFRQFLQFQLQIAQFQIIREAAGVSCQTHPRAKATQDSDCKLDHFRQWMLDARRRPPPELDGKIVLIDTARVLF
jgi:hypothetical protein